MRQASKPNAATFIALQQTEWCQLASVVKEHLAYQWHAKAGRWAPRKVRLVISLRLLPTPLATSSKRHLKPLVDWLAAQCAHIEVTASYKPEHRLYLE